MIFRSLITKLFLSYSLFIFNWFQILIIIIIINCIIYCIICMLLKNILNRRCVVIAAAFSHFIFIDIIRFCYWTIVAFFNGTKLFFPFVKLRWLCFNLTWKLSFFRYFNSQLIRYQELCWLKLLFLRIIDIFKSLI